MTKPIVFDQEGSPRRVLELFRVKWTTMVLHSLHFHGGTCKTGVLTPSLSGCSMKMLTKTLREMVRDGPINRKVYPVVPPVVEYSLTPLGELLIEPLEMLYDWAAKHHEVPVEAHQAAKVACEIEKYRRVDLRPASTLAGDR